MTNKFFKVLLICISVVFSSFTETQAETTGSVDGIVYEFNEDIHTATIHRFNDIKYVEIPENVSFKGEIYHVTSYISSAFSSQTFESVVLPDFLDYSYTLNFSDCKNLKKIVFPSESANIKSLNMAYCSSLEEIDIPNTVQMDSIEGMFQECTSLKRVKLPKDGTKKIPDYCFYNCSSLESISIPAAIQEIDSWAFRGCESLSEISFEGSIPKRMFAHYDGCKSLNRVNIKDLSEWLTYNWNGSDYNPLSIARHLYLNGKEVAGELIIPSDVTKIGDDAMNNCLGITALTVHNGVTDFGYESFDGCDNLNHINIYSLEAWCSVNFGSNPLIVANHLYLNGDEIIDLNIPDSITSIAPKSFHGGKFIKNAVIPNSVKEIGSSAFANCTALKSIKLPDELETIEYSLFDGCTSLTDIKIPSSVIFIELYAFYECSSLKNITLPEGLKEMRSSVFVGCSSLEEIVIPPFLTVVKNRTFEDCTNLKYVTLSSNVEEIESAAFDNCEKLSDIYCYAINPPDCARPFEGCPINNIFVHVPATSVNDYKTAHVWCDFGHIIGDLTSGVEDVTTNNDLTTLKKVYNLQGCFVGELSSGQISKLPKGIYISNGQKIYVR